MTVTPLLEARGCGVKIHYHLPASMTNKNTDKETSIGEKSTNKGAIDMGYKAPSEHNEFIADKQYLHGHDFEELVAALSYPQMLYFTLTGELANEQQAAILELLLKLFITPDARHPATRAAANAATGRAEISHILPISLSALSADYLGCIEVGNGMRWLSENLERNIADVIAEKAVAANKTSPNPIPGLGTIYGAIDTYTLKFIPMIKALGFQLPHFAAAEILITELQHAGVSISWLPTGLAAALFLDIGLDYRTGTVLYQLLQSPGLAAHGIENANKPHPFTRM